MTTSTASTLSLTMEEIPVINEVGTGEPFNQRGLEVLTTPVNFKPSVYLLDACEAVENLMDGAGYWQSGKYLIFKDTLWLIGPMKLEGYSSRRGLGKREEGEQFVPLLVMTKNRDVVIRNDSSTLEHTLEYKSEVAAVKSAVNMHTGIVMAETPIEFPLCLSEDPVSKIPHHEMSLLANGWGLKVINMNEVHAINSAEKTRRIKDGFQWRARAGRRLEKVMRLTWAKERYPNKEDEEIIAKEKKWTYLTMKKLKAVRPLVNGAKKRILVLDEIPKERRD